MLTDNIKDDGSVDVLDISKNESILLLKTLKSRYTLIQKVIEADESERKKSVEAVYPMLHDGQKAGDNFNYLTEGYAAFFAAEYSLIYDILTKSGVKL